MQSTRTIIRRGEIKVEQVNETSNSLRNTATEDSLLFRSKPKEELGEYSDGVQKRIAKLTRKMREAERQKEEAIKFAQQANNKHKKCEVSMTT